MGYISRFYLVFFVLYGILWAQSSNELNQNDTLQSRSENSASQALEKSKTTDSLENTNQTPVESSSPVDPGASVKDQHAATGILRIITEPDSAIIIFDSIPRGKSPFVIDNITPGQHEIIIRKKGYYIKKAMVNVAAGSDNTVTFELLKPLSLTVISEPAEAVVYVDTKKMGTTPFTDKTMKPGTYTIRVAKEGYGEFSQMIAVGEAENDTLEVTLVPGITTQKSVTQKKSDTDKNESRVSKILDRVALGIFVGFSLTILLVELIQRD